jgi:hypothetical protein
LEAESYQWMQTKSIWQSVHEERKDLSQVRPMGEPPLVTAGAPSLALPAKGIMWVLKPEAASPGERLAWVERSGSLKDMRCLEPEEIALEAAADHGPVKLLDMPQRRGTNSMPETLRPDELEAQL